MLAGKPNCVCSTLHSGKTRWWLHVHCLHLPSLISRPFITKKKECVSPMSSLATRLFLTCTSWQTWSCCILVGQESFSWELFALVRQKSHSRKLELPTWSVHVQAYDSGREVSLDVVAEYTFTAQLQTTYNYLFDLLWPFWWSDSSAYPYAQDQQIIIFSQILHEGSRELRDQELWKGTIKLSRMVCADQNSWSQLQMFLQYVQQCSHQNLQVKGCK